MYMQVTNLNIQNVRAECVRIVIDDFPSFSTVDILLGDSRITLFVENPEQASAVAEKFCTVTRHNHIVDAVRV